ncbi:MAG TPA: hypothetical protein VHE37_13905, partial [Nevskiaceae bacterium]|nr:hypothetical protein [Nevskiaceae bacterium]
ISKPTHIRVQAVNPQVSVVDATHARVNFSQAYESDSFNDQVNKVLELKLVNGAWKITREYTR